MSKQSPMQEMAERTAETAPGLAAAAHMEAVQNFRHLNADHRRRLADSHRWQGASLGQTVSDPSEKKEDDVGNLIVTGDVYGSDAAEIIRSLQSVAEPSQGPSEPAKQTGWVSNLGKAALVAAGLSTAGGLGAAVPWLLGAYEKPEAMNTTIVEAADFQRLGIEVVPGGASE